MLDATVQRRVQGIVRSDPICLAQTGVLQEMVKARKWHGEKRVVVIDRYGEMASVHVTTDVCLETAM